MSDRRGPGLHPWGKGFIAWFGFCALIGIGLLALLAWAVIRLVTHFT
jgi:hypothetical protein